MGNFTTSRDCKIDDKEIKQSEELGINFSKVHTDIHKAIFLRFSWRYFWKIFVLSKDYSNRYNTKYFWLEKAYIDILNYFDEYPNRWNLDYSRKVIAEKFDDILLSLDSYKPINNENKCEGCDTEEEDSDTDDFWTNKQRQRNHHINHDSESSWALQLLYRSFFLRVGCPFRIRIRKNSACLENSILPSSDGRIRSA